MKTNTNCCWEEHVKKDSVIIATRTILYPCLDVETIKYVAGLPHSLCNKNSHKLIFKGIQFVSLIMIMIIF